MRHSTRNTSVLLIVACLAAGCSDPLHVPTPASVNSDDVVGALRILGYDTRGLVDRGDDLIVEGDIILRRQWILDEAKRRLADQRLLDSTHVARQWYESLVDDSHISTIKVRIDGQMDAAYQTAARGALQIWSSVTGSRIDMVEGEPADIVIYGGGWGYCGAGHNGCSGPPQNGAPYSIIYIDDSWVADASQKKYLVAHELGHTVGFRHSDSMTGTNCTYTGESTTV